MIMTEKTNTQYYSADVPSDESSQMTLWMGDLEPWMDEQYLQKLWSLKGEQVVIKLIRDKRSGNSVGYAFIGFRSTLAAQRALTTLHGTALPDSQTHFRLNWAAGGGIFDKKEDRAPEYSLFVGDLSNDLDETYLLAMFRQRYGSCHSAKIMTDPVSGLSRGYGFVRFHDPLEQQNALMQMNGVLCGHRPLRISLATPKGNNNLKTSVEPTSAPLSPLSSSSTLSTSMNNNVAQLQHMQARYNQLALQAPALVQQPTDPSNTTVFVGGLSTPLSEDELRYFFEPFGEITYVKIPPGKGCGFVQFVKRQAAEWAIEQMNGYQVGQSRIRLSWGRSQYDKAGGASQSLPVPTQHHLSSARTTQLHNNPFYMPPPSPTISSPLSAHHDPLSPHRTMANQSAFSFPAVTTINQSSYLRKPAHPINHDYDTNPISSSRDIYPHTSMFLGHSPTTLFGQPASQRTLSSSPSNKRFSFLFSQQDDHQPYYDHGIHSPASSTNNSSTLAPLSTSPQHQEQQSVPEWPSQTLFSINRTRTSTVASNQESNQINYCRRQDDIYA